MIREWLKILQVQTICQWDVLVFLYRHRTAMLGPDHIARLLSYGTNLVVDALSHLESLGLVERSRRSQGARLYQLARPSENHRGRALEELLALTATRFGRMKIAENLREMSGRAAIFLYARNKVEAGAISGRHSALESRREDDKWPKAI
jgi:DNA-binding MarR family transcriptional regulator